MSGRQNPNTPITHPDTHAEPATARTKPEADATHCLPAGKENPFPKAIAPTKPEERGKICPIPIGLIQECHSDLMGKTTCATRWPPGGAPARTVQRLGRRVVNLSLAGQFGARRAPVGLAAGPGTALSGLPLVVPPSCGPVRSCDRTARATGSQPASAGRHARSRPPAADCPGLRSRPATGRPRSAGTPSCCACACRRRCRQEVSQDDRLPSAEQRIPRHTAQVLRFRPHPLEHVLGPQPHARTVRFSIAIDNGS